MAVYKFDLTEISSTFNNQSIDLDNAYFLLSALFIKNAGESEQQQDPKTWIINTQ
jgi:hypothetical protein